MVISKELLKVCGLLIGLLCRSLAYSQNLESYKKIFADLKSDSTSFTQKFRNDSILLENEKNLIEVSQSHLRNKLDSLENSDLIITAKKSYKYPNGYRVKKGDSITVIKMENLNEIVMKLEGKDINLPTEIRSPKDLQTIAMHFSSIKSIKKKLSEDSIKLERLVEKESLNFLKYQNNLKEHLRLVETYREMSSYEELRIEEDRIAQENRRKRLIAKYGEFVARRILRGEVWVGMSSTQAEESWGPPSVINSTKNDTSTKEQWVYGVISNRKYLYFENSILTTISE
jgi:hypothetical protein